MKKIYSVLAAAFAVSVSASAALNMPTPQKLQLPEKVVMPSSAMAPATVKKAKNVAKVAQPVDKIYGPYWTWSAQPYKDAEPRTGTLTISPSKTPGNIVISGLVMGAELDCPYNPATGEITIKGGMTIATGINFGPTENGGPDLIGDLTIQTRKWTVYEDPETGELTGKEPYDVEECVMPFINEYIDEESGKVVWSGVFDDSSLWNIITLSIYKDGADTGYGMQVNSGYFNTWVPFRERLTEFSNLRSVLGENCYFTFNENDWENKGEASFTDGWFTGFFKNTPAAYPVATYRYKNDPRFVFLLNPYSSEGGYAGTFTEQDGYSYMPNGGIMLDLTDKTLPVVVPCVPSGAGYWQFGQFFMTSQAGEFKYINNVPANQIKAYLEENKFDLPTMDNQYMVTLPNCRISNMTNIISITQWTNNAGAVDMISQIQLPEEAVVGVEGIVNDADVNAPVRYFNLQGVEVTAPAKGEVVVKKQGSKATKVVF